MTTTAPTYIDHCLYTEEDALASRRAREQAQNSNTDYAPPFRSPSLNDVLMLCPLFDRLEAELDVKLILGFNHDPDAALGHRYFTAGADITPGSNHVAIVRNASLDTPLRQSPAYEPPNSLPAVIDRTVEPETEVYTRWGTNTNASLGLVAPNLLTFHWWYRSAHSTPEQIDAIYNALRNAIQLAIDHEHWATHIDAMRRQLAREAATIVANRSSSEINAMRSQVPGLIEDIADLETRARAKQTRLDEIKLQLRALEDAQIPPDDLDATVERELHAILEHPDVRDVVPRPGSDPSSLDIITGDLPLTNVNDPTQTTVGGSYRLRMYFGADPRVRVRNLTRRLESYDHPHVSDGNFCLGDQRQLADQLIARSELSASVAFIIDLLKQVNPDDVYTSEWEAWFELPESEPNE